VLNLRRLRVLQAIAREQSLAGAARALSYTQPAIGFHLRQLELEVGTTLVLRQPRGVRLTPAGLALAARAERLLAEAANAEEEVAAIAGLRAGRVRLATFPSGSATIVPPALAALRARHPGLEVTLREREPPESLELLDAGECDVVLAFEYPQISSDALAHVHRRELTADPLHAVVPAEWPAPAAGTMDLARLRDETWIAGCPRCREHLTHLCQSAGFEPRIAFVTDDTVAVQAMVAAGLGVALLPKLILDLVHVAGTRALPLRGSPARTISAVATEGGAQLPAVGALLDALEAAAASAGRQRSTSEREAAG